MTISCIILTNRRWIEKNLAVAVDVSPLLSHGQLLHSLFGKYVLSFAPNSFFIHTMVRHWFPRRGLEKLVHPTTAYRPLLTTKFSAWSILHLENHKPDETFLEPHTGQWSESVLRIPMISILWSFFLEMFVTRYWRMPRLWYNSNVDMLFLHVYVLVFLS